MRRASNQHARARPPEQALLLCEVVVLRLRTSNVKRFRGGLVFKAHRLLYHPTLSLRVIAFVEGYKAYRGPSLIRNSPPLGTYSSIYLGPCGGPSGGAVSYERGTPVPNRAGDDSLSSVIPVVWVPGLGFRVEG